MTGSIKAKTKLRLREMLDEAIAQGVTAGVSLGIWQDGEELFLRHRAMRIRKQKGRWSVIQSTACIRCQSRSRRRQRSF